MQWASSAGNADSRMLIARWIIKYKLIVLYFEKSVKCFVAGLILGRIMQGVIDSE